MTRSPWDDLPGGLPVLRREAAYGDRVVRCFADRPASLHTLLERAVRAHPDADAVVCGDVRWTYARLDADVARPACGCAWSRARRPARGRRQRRAFRPGTMPRPWTGHRRRHRQRTTS